MFQIAAQMNESDLAPTAALKGYANKNPVMFGTVEYPTGTLRLEKFVGDKHGERYTGHLYFEVLDEPCAEHQRMDFAGLQEFAVGGQASDVVDPRITDAANQQQVTNHDQQDDPPTNTAGADSQASDAGDVAPQEGDEQ